MAVLRGKPCRVCQQVFHRPAQILPLGAQPEALGKIRLHPERNAPRGAQCSAGICQGGSEGCSVDRLGRRGGMLCLDGAAQGGQILPGPVGPPQDGVHKTALGIGKGILRQQFRIAADDGQGCFQIMGQCGKTLAALLFHDPLAFEGAGQLLPQSLHGTQRLVEFPEPGVPQGIPREISACQGTAGIGQQVGLLPEQGHSIPRGQQYRDGQQNQENAQPAEFKIRQDPAQFRVGIGCPETVLQAAESAVDQPYIPVIKRAYHRTVQLQRPVQIPAADVAAKYLIVGCNTPRADRGIQQDPAAEGGQGVGIKVVGGHGGQNVLGFQRCGCRAVGGQQHARCDQNKNQPEPESADSQTPQTGAHQITDQQAGQGFPRVYSLFHRYPIPHTVSMGCRPWARSLARMFFTCSVTAESSAVPPQPNTAS